MFECFRCGCRTAVWGCDYSTEDFGIEEDGVVSFLHCSNEDCNTTIEVTTIFEEKEV